LKRRAIYAHWALLQGIQGEPDTDPDDAVAVKQINAAEGFERAAVAYESRGYLPI